MSEALKIKGGLTKKTAEARIAAGIQKLSEGVITQVMIGRAKTDVGGMWNELIKVCNGEVTGKHNFEWLSKDERNAGRECKKTRMMVLQTAGARKRYEQWQHTPERNADTYTFMANTGTFKDRDGGPVAILKGIKADLDGVVLVYDPASIASMAT